MPGRETGTVVAVSRSSTHGFSKVPQPEITLLEGLGVEGDAHAGVTVQHLYRIKLDRRAPNLAQVHLLPVELFDEMAALGYTLEPGALGENVLTQGLDLAAMPTGATFHIGGTLLEISGIRDPCRKIEALGKGLTKAMFGRTSGGGLLRKAGIMAVVRRGGTVRPGDPIVVALPSPPHRPLSVV